MLCELHTGFRRLHTRKDTKQRVNVVQYELHVEMVLMIILAVLSQIKYVIQGSFPFFFFNVENAQSAPGNGRAVSRDPLDAGLRHTRTVSPAPGRQDSPFLGVAGRTPVSLVSPTLHVYCSCCLHVWVAPTRLCPAPRLCLSSPLCLKHLPL